MTEKGNTKDLMKKLGIIRKDKQKLLDENPSKTLSKKQLNKKLLDKNHLKNHQKLYQKND